LKKKTVKTGPRPHERWYYVNGIMNSEWTTQGGIKRLNQLFDAETILLYNPTQGMFLDLLECFMARDLQWPTVPAIMTHKKIQKQLYKPRVKKVVLFGHSQGCIICADVLQFFDEDLKKDAISAEMLQKLEVYLFASPADIVSDAGGNIHVELFANEADLVSRLGVLAPKIVLPNAAPDTDKVFKNKRNGHLLVEHYLRDDFTDMVYRSSNIDPKLRTNSRLYTYFQRRRN